MTNLQDKWFARQRKDGTHYIGVAGAGWNLYDRSVADFIGENAAEHCQLAVRAVNSHDALVKALERAVGALDDWLHLMPVGDGNEDYVNPIVAAARAALAAAKEK